MSLTKSRLCFLKAQVDFIIGEVPNNFWLLHVSNPPYVILPRSTKVHNYVVSIFGFVNKWILYVIFHDNEHHVLKNIKSYLDDFNDKIHSKWAITNCLCCTSPKFRFKKVISHPKHDLSSKISFQILCLKFPFTKIY
jgi:hypothetical protein